jgi:GT2 family glycosyltransferase
MGEITVILNGYKRPQFLKEQIHAIKNQTVPVKEIMVWLNNTEGFDVDLLNSVTTVSSNKNFGVWARFAFALNAKTEYICIFDDDTIPGNMWFENCLNTIKTHEGLLGTIGLIYETPNSYMPYTRYGWDNPNNTTQKVDIVGHCWFFKREWLSTFWRELPPSDLTMVGEDMHFSYMIQKYLQLGTYVPPHPMDNREMWGSLKGWEMGTEPNALSFISTNINLMNHYHNELLTKGFNLIKHGK